MVCAKGAPESLKHIRRITAICEHLLEELTQTSAADLMKLGAILENTGNSFLGLAEDVRQEIPQNFAPPARVAVPLRLILGGTAEINDLRS